MTKYEIRVRDDSSFTSLMLWSNSIYRLDLKKLIAYSIVVSI